MRTGRRLRDVDVIVVVHVIPAVVPAHLAVLRAAGVGRTSTTGRGPRSVVIAHNVLPHEGHPGDRQLMAAFLSASTPSSSTPTSRRASRHPRRHPRQGARPPAAPAGRRPRTAPRAAPGDTDVRLLSLGIVRDYKGVDLLADAVRTCPGPAHRRRRAVGDAGRRVRELAADPRLEGRVEVHGGYVPADRIAGLMAQHDVVALTYRSATASQNALLARRHGLPVLASAVGTFPDQVRDGVDGVLVPPGDRDALVGALRRLAARRGRRPPGRGAPPDLAGPWANYVGGIEALAAAPLDVADEAPRSRSARWRGSGRPSPASGPAVGRSSRSAPPTSPSGCVPPTCSRSTTTPSTRSASRAPWACRGRVSRSPPGPRSAPSPRSCASATTGTARPSSSTSPAAAARWAAGRGPSGSPRSSSSSPGGGRRRGARRRHRQPRRHHPAHPGGCTASDVDHAVGQASWALRSGGLLVVTVPIGEDDPEFAVRAADVRGILARADDLGLRLVGDVDGDVLDRMREARGIAAGGGAPAYAVLRLTFRRR